MEERRISPAIVIIPVGVGLAAVVGIAAVALAAPPTPPPGRANLYGRVTDAVTGNPIPDVLVTLNAMQAYTDSGGNYALLDLELRAYYITFQKGGYDMSSQDITLHEGDNPLNVAMTPIAVLARLFGTVTEANVDSLGYPNPNAGQPLANARVELWSPDETELLLHTLTSSSGYYLMENILPGNYAVYFKKDGYETQVR